MKNGRAWGQDAWQGITWKRVGRAAYNAALDLQTLIPAAGAVVFAIGDLDQQTYDWANKHHPIFGSQDTARTFSDVGRYVLAVEPLVTALLTPSGEGNGEWTANKLKGLSVEAAAQLSVWGTTQGLKSAVGTVAP